MLADRILSREHLAGQRFVDDRDPRRGERVQPAEGPPAHDRDSQRRRMYAGPTAFGAYGPSARSAETGASSPRDRVETSMRYPIGAPNDVLTCPRPAATRAGVRARRRTPVRGCVSPTWCGSRRTVRTFARLESQVHGLRALHAANAESRHDQQHERPGHLRDDHRAAQPLPSGASRSAWPPSCRSALTSARACAQCRRDAHQHPRRRARSRRRR